MSSQQRIDASRANALKSTGPVTPEGKQKCSRNAVRHGLLCTQALMLPGEDESAFHQLLADLIDELNPVTGIEMSLVEVMATAKWRRHRCMGLETAGWLTEIVDQDVNTPLLAVKHPAARGFVAFRGMIDNSNALPLLARYELRYDRQYERALKLLEARQAARVAKKKNEEKV